MRGILVVAMALSAVSGFAAAATSADWLDISDAYVDLEMGATVFPSLLKEPADLVFDNSAVLPFSTGPYGSGGTAWINFPLQNSNLTIHSLLKSFDDSGPPDNYAFMNISQDFHIGDMPNAYYTNRQGSSDDPGASNYFPYNIPRPERDAAHDYTAVYFDFNAPVTQFGVYLPCASDNWENSPAYADNYQFLSAKWTDVYVLHQNDTFLTAERFQFTLTGYAPFVRITDPDGFVGVVIRDNCALNGGPTFGFMDVYATMGVPPQPHAGDANNDGHCDVVDLGILAKWYGYPINPELPPPPPNLWEIADFNGDGNVDVVDLGILAKNYDWVGAPAGSSVVPEPMTLSLLAVGAAALIRRRR